MAADEPQDPFAPPGGEDAPMELALEIEKPSRPSQQTVAPEAAAPARGATSERSSSSSAGLRPAEPTSNSGLHRQPEPPAPYRGPREGVSNVLLWGLAGLGLLALIGSAVRFLRGGSGEPVAAQGAASDPPSTPTTWKPVDLGPNVLVTIDVSPRSARLLLDGEPLASNPVPLIRGSKHTLGALADGFEGGLQNVVADKRKTVRIVLHPSRKRH